MVRATMRLRKNLFGILLAGVQFLVVLTSCQSGDTLVVSPEASLRSRPDIAGWLTTSADNISYIYGETDPGTAAGITPDPGTETRKIVQADDSHCLGNNDLDLRNQHRVKDCPDKWPQQRRFSPS